MPSLGWEELVIILVIVIIIFGAGKLPEIGGAMGKSIKEFKKEAESLSGDSTELPSGTNAATTVNNTVGSVTKEASQVRADEI